MGKQESNFDLKILYKVGLLLFAVVFVILSVVTTANLLNYLDLYNSTQVGTEPSVVVYSGSTILWMIVTAFGWLFSMFFLSFAIANLFKSYKFEKSFYLGLVIVAVIYGIFFVIVFSSYATIFDFKQVVNEDQANIDSLSINFFTYSIFFEMLSFIMLILTIPFKKSRELQTIQQTIEETKEVEDDDEDLFAEQRQALENEIKEQKQKQKLFQLQQELEELKQNTEAMKGNIKAKDNNE